MRTHYDNLQLTRDASAEDIRRAYRRLSKKYHPDLNPHPDAHRIMQIINQAYEVLSDPVRRAEHNLWIDAQQQQRFIGNPSRQYPITTTQTTRAEPRIMGKKAWVAVGVACVILLAQIVYLAYRFGVNSGANETHSNHLEAMSASRTAPQEMFTPTLPTPPSHYVRPTTAPNGNPLPRDTGYIDGYPQMYGTRHNYTVIVDNVKNSSDVFGELFWLDAPLVPAFRTFFIRERGQMALTNLDEGRYGVRYRQLDGGEELNSETVVLNQDNREQTIYLQRGAAPVVP